MDYDEFRKRLRRLTLDRRAKVLEDLTEDLFIAGCRPDEYDGCQTCAALDRVVKEHLGETDR